MACTLYFLGDFETSGQFAIRGVQIWRSLGARSPVVGVDNARRSFLSYKALFEAHFGEITSSHATMAEAISFAEELKDMYGRAMALSFAASLEVDERNLGEVERYSSDLIELSTRHHFAHFLARRIDSQGWARSASGDTAEGLPWIEDAIRAFRATGSMLSLPYYLSLRRKLYIWRVVLPKRLRQ